MAKARELKRRIRSVENTRKITKTMEMVATSKLKRAQDRVVGARPYAEALAEVIGDLYSPALAERFPLLRQPGPDIRRVGISFFRFSKRAVASQRIDIGDRPTAAHAAELTAPLMAEFEAGRLDAV